MKRGKNQHCCVFLWVWSVIIILKVLEPRGESRESEEGSMKGGGKKEKPIGDCRMDAQVLLLIEPGAELGWAELSDRLPSIGGERKQDNR